MEKKKRDLSVSSLSESQIRNIGLKELKNLKLIGSAEFDRLPGPTKSAVKDMFDQSFVIWKDHTQVDKLSMSKLVELVEPYKTRKFKTLPGALRDNLLDLFASKTQTSKSNEFLLWFIEKQDFLDDNLPEQVKFFLSNMYLSDPTTIKTSQFVRLVEGLKKYPMTALTKEQKIFIDKAMSLDIDTISNEEFFALAAFAKGTVEAGTKYEDLSDCVQEFVWDCYIRCAAQNEIVKNNKQMKAIWFRNGYDLNPCFADFNRAFAGLKNFDAVMAFDNPAQKLKLEHMINYANMQSRFVREFEYDMHNYSVFAIATAIARELELPIIYQLCDDAYYYSDTCTLPPKVTEYQDDCGYTRQIVHETLRNYRQRIEPAFAKIFGDMLYQKSLETVSDKNNSLSLDDQRKCATNFVNLFEKGISQNSSKKFHSIARQPKIDKNTFASMLYSTAASLIEEKLEDKNFAASENKIQTKPDQARSVQPEVEYEDPQKTKRELKDSMDKLVEEYSNPKISVQRKQEIEQLYLDLEDKYYYR